MQADTERYNNLLVCRKQLHHGRNTRRHISLCNNNNVIYQFNRSLRSENSTPQIISKRTLSYIAVNLKIKLGNVNLLDKNR